MHWKIVVLMLIMALIILSGCTDTPNKKCDWVGPGARAVYVCKIPSPAR